MNNLNYVFFEEFKHLDKLCGDLYGGRHGITSYIDDMKEVSGKDYQYVSNWKVDLEQLIRLRHIRNYLAHTEGAFNEKICTQKDIDWICDFYSRILSQTDPIALLYQTSKEKCQISKQDFIDEQTNNYINDPINKEARLFYGIIWLFVIIVIMLMFVIGCAIVMRYLY